MKNQISKKVAAMVTSAMLITSVAAPMAVMAEEAESPAKKVTITKKIVKPADVYAPKTNFTFEIKSGTPVPGTADSEAIKAGVAGGVTFEDNDIQSAPAAEDLGKDTMVLEDTAKLKINIDEFNNAGPGIYRYLVKEKKGDYNGMGYDKNEKYFDVYIRRENGQLQAYSWAFVKKTNIKEKDSGEFVNYYGKPDDPNSDENAWLNEVKVTKEVAGALGDKEKSFDFDITITGQTGENFNLKKSDGSTVKLVTGEKQTVQLKHGENFVVTGLSKDDKYVVNEHDYTADGYKTVNTGDLTKTMADKGNLTVAFTNTADTTTPTGVLMTYGPYALLIVATGVLLTVYTRKKRTHEEE